jgi:hypothetical protein
MATVFYVKLIFYMQAKISDYGCVLRECSSRVPDDYTAAKELLLYGLSKTSFR